MQKVSRTFDQKRQMIDKIQGRRQPRDKPHLTHGQQEVTLPSLTPTPTTKMKQTSNFTTTISTQFKNSIENQLDSIINETLSHFRNQKVSKIIFTSPITNRLGKTYYRSDDQSIYNTSRHKYHPSRRHSTIDPPARTLNSSIIGTHKPIKPAYGLDFRSSLMTDNSDFNQFYGQEQFKSAKGRKVSQRYPKKELRRGKEQSKEKRNDCLSPWKDEEGEDELL